MTPAGEYDTRFIVYLKTSYLKGVLPCAVSEYDMFD